tara:strand:- start:357 stop:1514 length:1158 start_codon:yes stop_codon:yes gene_type:complete
VGLSKNKANLLLVLFGCALAFIVTEVALRAYNPFQFRVKGNKIRLPVFFNYKFELKNTKRLDKLVIHTKNSIGFRGEEEPEKPEKYLTIIAVGGSTTENFIITDGKTWPAILGVKLKESFKRVWINNAGLDGHSTFGHAVLMEDYIVKIKPKVVLFLVGINDVWLTETPNGYDIGLKRDLTINLGSIKAFFRTAGNYSEVFALAYNLYRFSKKIHYPYTNVSDSWLEKFITLDIPKNQEINIVNKELEEFNKKYKRGYSLRLKKLIKLSKENSIQPVLITQPALYGNEIDDLTQINLGSIKVGNGRNGNIAWRRLELFNNMTREIGLEKKVLVIDLANEMPKSSRYFYDTVHYNNEGARKVAEIIDKSLQPFLRNKYGEYAKNFN